MSDTQPAAASGATRIKRNSACTSCRDAKVRCNPSLQPSQPCQRCTKLGLECLVDKTHKRVSRKSKLDELVQEIQTIKKTVGDRSNQSQVHVPTSGLLQQPLVAPSYRDLSAVGPGLISPSLSRPAVASSATATLSSDTQTPATTLVAEHNVEPSLPRALGSQPFSGADIDYYFQKFFEHFHPYLPIVRYRDPNKCYETGTILFWTIVMTACRRYAKNATLMPFLLETVRRDLFSAMTELPLSLSTINALLLVCTWAFPDVRFVTDPTPLFSAAAMNAALLLGLHRGRGWNPEFSFGLMQVNFSDEEAAYTWAGYNIVAQRCSTWTGLPPLGGSFNQTVQNVIDGKTPFHVPSGFRVLLECQKFANRLSKTMAACLEEPKGVSAHVVRQLEDEFDHIRGLICAERADDLDHLNALIVQLEIQTYYLIPLPGYDPEALKRDVVRAYTTAQAVIRQIVALDDKTSFVKHLTHFYLRSALAATTVVYKVMRSSYMEFLSPKDAENTMADAITLYRRAVVMEEDLATRLANLLESLQGVAQLPIWHKEPISIYSHRLGASINFDCLKRWKDDMSNTKSQPPPAEGSQTPALLLGADSMGTIDWGFMDDFDWNMESNLSGVSFPPVT